MRIENKTFIKTNRPAFILTVRVFKGLPISFCETCKMLANHIVALKKKKKVYLFGEFKEMFDLELY